MRDVLFRTDFNNQIGSGHYFRCIALAEIIKGKFKIHFVFDKKTVLIHRLPEYIDTYYIVENENDFIELIKPGSIIVIDIYDFNENLQRKLNFLKINLIVIDDMNNMNYDCDVIINHGSLFTKTDYKCIRNSTKIYTGLDYLLVRKEFREYSINKRVNKINDKFDHVFICLGSTDQIEIINKIIDSLLDSNVKNFSILIDAKFKDKVVKSFNENVSIDVYFSLTPHEIIHIIENSDFAVLSSSTILLEVFTIGLPVIAGWFVENQKNSLSRYEEIGLLVNVGNFHDFHLSANLRSAFLLLKDQRKMVDKQKNNIMLKDENYFKFFEI